MVACNRRRTCALSTAAYQLLKELGMKQKSVRPNDWTKPEIRRLGTIKDVAGAQGAGTQAAGLKT
jgi:hypothetical protein